MLELNKKTIKWSCLSDKWGWNQVFKINRSPGRLIGRIKKDNLAEGERV